MANKELAEAVVFLRIVDEPVRQPPREGPGIGCDPVQQSVNDLLPLRTLDGRVAQTRGHGTS